MTAKIAEYFPICANIKYIRARILRQSEMNEKRIIDQNLGDDHCSYAENLSSMNSQVNDLSATRN
jgi:hypothetical protein